MEKQPTNLFCTVVLTSQAWPNSLCMSKGNPARNKFQKMKYSIHSSKTGETLIQSIDLDETEIEAVSSDTPEGHFRAGELANDELVKAGLDKDESVYALVK